MTVRPGDEWGRTIARPHDLRVVDDDAALLAAITDGTGRPTAMREGDLARTLGGSTLSHKHDQAELGEFPIDLFEVRFDDGTMRLACAHLLIRAPWWRGSWWRESVVAVMNAEFRSSWDVAPRGHPNDGRLETLVGDPKLSIRDRWAVRKRLPNGSHLPHPGISTDSIETVSYEFPRPMEVILDGRRIGRTRNLNVSILPDAGLVHI